MIKPLFIVLLSILPYLELAPKPKVLIIGDSISIGYFPFVKEELKNEAELVHNAGNAQDTANGLKKIDSWLGNTKWDIIQFNWGLWDIAYRNPASKEQGNRDKINGTIAASPEQYKKNMEELIAKLKKTGAKLIFVTTTVVPEKEAGRFVGDEDKYNAIAIDLMKKNGITINNLHQPSVSIHQKLGLGADNVHYSDEGYKQLAKPIIDLLRQAMK
ncbi:MAG: GDSL-like Lipase/Acylhydrolase family [Sphingobacteriaceae bacterium]|jgi:lysophospholipase L1-like esterase|nr:GDSL-like Lipase/Acylhydrolase family [Sphingobacteriaceae bacterium]